jgi:hypothetical protein
MPPEIAEGTETAERVSPQSKRSQQRSNNTNRPLKNAAWGFKVLKF